MSKPVLEYVDTHCHLDNIYQRIKKTPNYSFESFTKNFEPGFAGCLTVFSDSFENTLQFLTNSFPNVYGALGIHPHNAIIYNDEIEEALANHMTNPKVVALGEIGLDYHYDNSPRDVQRAVFERQLLLGVRLGKPIVIHTREAEEDTITILRRSMPKEHRFHVHCYTDSYNLAEMILNEWPNSFIGFTGVLTFPKSDSVKEVCSKIPLDRILSETDGPYMAPVPFRGKAATPGHIPYIIREIARLHKVTDEEAFRVLRENCRRMYGF